MSEFLLNPNVAYLLLVAGFSLAVMSMLTPGTGLFEIGALFSLLLAGYGVANLPFNYWALALLLVGIVLFVIAILRPGRLAYLAVAIAALVGGSAFLFRSEGLAPAVDPLLALLVSTATAVYFWLAATKALKIKFERPIHDLGGLLGALGEAKSEISGDGSVQVNGELWSARSARHIPRGAQVRVIGREGFILQVEDVVQSTQPQIDPQGGL